ncbi:MAG: hypothetical protein FD153_1549 [Rhodospirillaceae bacterium]|nr:MAG: hypothetical protein FD153_1549 [Rhodospirillaceae bacterium]
MDTEQPASGTGLLSFLQRCLGMVGSVTVLSVIGCAPFIDEPFSGTERIALPDPAVRDVVTVCYNNAFTTPETVTALAREACDRRGKVPRFLGQSGFRCRLLVPATTTFICIDQTTTSHHENLSEK